MSCGIRVGTVAAVVSLLIGSFIPAVHAATGEGGALDFAECQVYAVDKPSVTFDCVGNIRKACGSANPCDVVIGLALTDGQQIDGDSKAWKKVRVRYHCGSKMKVVGPYVQSEHATIRLVCQARPL